MRSFKKSFLLKLFSFLFSTFFFSLDTSQTVTAGPGFDEIIKEAGQTVERSTFTMDEITRAFEAFSKQARADVEKVDSEIIEERMKAAAEIVEKASFTMAEINKAYDLMRMKAAEYVEAGQVEFNNLNGTFEFKALGGLSDVEIKKSCGAARLIFYTATTFDVCRDCIRYAVSDGVAVYLYSFQECARDSMYGQGEDEFQIHE